MLALVDGDDNKINTSVISAIKLYPLYDTSTILATDDVKPC